MKITAAAYSRLKTKLRGQPTGTAVRIAFSDGQVTFRPDMKQDGDLVFAHKGKSMLLVAPESAGKVASRTLGVVETASDHRLRFVRSGR